MAATNVQSGDDALNSPRVSSPWSRVVSGGGGESEHASNASPVVVMAGDPAPVETAWSSVPEHVVKETDDSGGEGMADGGGNAAKKPVWNRPSNGVVDAFSPVMGAAWPALGESTKPTLKSSSLSDDSLLPALQVTGSSSPSHKQANAVNLNSASAPNHVAPSRQRSMKRGGGNSSANVSANGVVSQLPRSQDPAVDPSHNTSGKVGNAADQPSLKDNAHRETQKGGFVSQSHSGNDHHHQRGSYRRGGGGQHPRGDGSYHHNSYGGKRDHDRGNQEWNQHSRSFNNRDTHLQSQRGFSRGYIRPSVHTSAPFIPPPMPVPMHPFGNNIMYPDVAPHVVYYPGPLPPPMPFGAPLSPMYYSDPVLNANIVSQIDYYFSNENLVRDTYLRRNMDEQGWVSASLIAGFKKVSSLTDNVPLILDVMRTSTVVEVQGDKIRRRNDWMKWIMPAPGQYLNPSSPQANHEGLVSQVQSLALHGRPSTNQVPVETQFSRSSSEEFTGGGEGVTSQQAGFNHASAA